MDKVVKHKISNILEMNDYTIITINSSNADIAIICNTDNEYSLSKTIFCK